MRRLAISVVALVGLALGFSGAAAAWSWPTDGPVLRPFELGANPYAGGQHRGIDVGAKADDAALSPVAGTITFAGAVPTHGRTVAVLTDDGYSVTLAHLGSLRVARGDVVAEGQPLGTVGPSGAPELAVPYVHLGVRVLSREEGYVDPLRFMPPREAAPPPTAGEASPAPAPIVTPAAAPRAAPPEPVTAPAVTPSLGEQRVSAEPAPGAAATSPMPAGAGRQPAAPLTAAHVAPMAMPSARLTDGPSAMDRPASVAKAGFSPGRVGSADQAPGSSPAPRAAPDGGSIDSIAPAPTAPSDAGVVSRPNPHRDVQRRGAADRLDRSDRLRGNTPASNRKGSLGSPDPHDGLRDALATGVDLARDADSRPVAGWTRHVPAAAGVGASPGRELACVPSVLALGLLVILLLVAARAATRRLRTIDRDGAVLRHDADLLRQLDAAHRSCLHDHRGRRLRAAPAPARA